MTTKLCSKCNQTFDIDGFYKKNATRKQSYCKNCFNSYCMERWKALKLRTIEDFGGKCLDCSGVFPSCCYDFHHLDPAIKEFNWTKLRQMAEHTRIKELAKCVLLCSNCHRIRHYANDDLV